MRDDVNIGVEERALDDGALEALAGAYATAPPVRLRARILAAARADSGRAATVQRAVARWRLVGAVAAVIALALAGLLAREAGRARVQADELAALARANTEMGARLAEQERTVAGLRESLAAQAQVLRVLAGPRTLTATLVPTAEGGRGSGRVVVDPTSGDTAVVLAGLDPVPAGRVYELWAIRGGGPPEPAGLFGAETGGPLAARGERVPRPDEVTAFAVSIEPAGGSPSPTGPVVLVGPVAG